MNETRRKRLEARILRLVAELSIKGLKDPHIGFTTFTSCTLSNDGSHATIKVSVFEEPEEKIKTLKALHRAAGYLQHRISGNLQTKVVPRLHFELDESLDRAEGIEKLIDDSQDDNSEEN